MFETVKPCIIYFIKVTIPGSSFLFPRHPAGVVATKIIKNIRHLHSHREKSITAQRRSIAANQTGASLWFLQACDDERARYQCYVRRVLGACLSLYSILIWLPLRKLKDLYFYFSSLFKI